MSAALLTVGKYQVVRKLAAGGMAEVFLARAAGPMGFEKQVVVKRILPHLAEEENFISMFLGEARLAAQLNHPNVVQVFDFGEAEGAYFLVMEFIDGINLRVLFRKAHEQQQPLPFPLVARIVSLACEGLAYAHDFVDPQSGEHIGLVHRDVSPDNILIARNGSVKVVDFGIAKAANTTNLTKTGTVKGKFSYMPPEQLTGQPLDKRADVFALGIVLFELLTGRKPFDTSNEAFIVRAIMYEPLARAESFRPGTPPELQEILDRALAKNRDERYPDCRAMQEDLERFLQRQGQPVSQYQLAQLVQKLAPAAPAPPQPTPSGPAMPPMAEPPVAATVPEAVDVELSTALLATPRPQPSVVALAPTHRREQPPPPPVPTGTLPMPTPAQLAPPPVAPVSAGASPPTAAIPPPRASAPMPTIPDLGSISLKDELSGERAPPAPPAERRGGALPVVLLLAAVAVGGGATWFFLGRSRAEPPPPIVQPAPPSPQPLAAAPQPAAPPEPTPPAPAPPPEAATPPEPAAPPEPAPTPTPEPVAAAPTPAPAPEPAAPTPAVAAPPIAAKKPPVTSPAPVRRPPVATRPAPPPPSAVKGQVEFRVRPFGAVFVDGAFLGETPFAPAALAVGTHEVRVVNRELGKEVTRSLEVKEGSNVFRYSFEE